MIFVLNTHAGPPARRRDARGTSHPQARRTRDLLFHNQLEAVDADGAAELRAFADGDAGQMGVDGGADVVRRLLVLLDAFHEMRDHRGEGMVVAQILASVSTRLLHTNKLLDGFISASRVSP